MSRTEKWERIPIAELIEKGRSATSQDDDSVVWNLNLDQIEPDTGRILKKVRAPISELGSSTYPFEANTVLYSKLRPYLNKVVVPDEDGWATTELVPLKCKPKVWPYFLAYLLRGQEFLSFANATVAGAKMPRMVMEKFWEYEVPLPPLPEQKRIASILDSADAIRQKRKAAIAKLDNLAQSVFLEMFGDPVKNEKGWKVAELASVAEIKIGPFGSLLHKEDYIPDGTPLINPCHMIGLRVVADPDYSISQEKLRDLSAYRVRQNDIVFARRGEIGRCAIITKTEDGFLCGTGSMFVRPNEEIVDSQYLLHAMTTKSVKKILEGKSKGITMKNLNSEELGSTVVAIPPKRSQQRMTEMLRSAEVVATGHQAALLLEDKLFASLQQRAFAGEL